MRLNHRHLLGALALCATLGLTNGCQGNNASAFDDANSFSAKRPTPGQRASYASRVAMGTTLRVQLGQMITSETAHYGDIWRGTVADDVISGSSVVIPAGSAVTGMVTTVVPAKRGSRAVLDLAVRHIRINGRDETVTASMSEIVAGSTRTRNVGAVAGGAVVGAVLGKAIGNGNHAGSGAVIGGATTAGVLATRTKGYQVELRDGMILNFTTSESVTMR